jgi:hypothetical protein
MAKFRIVLSLSLFLGSLSVMSLPAHAGNAGTRLTAPMAAGSASGKADYREQGNQRRLTVKAEGLAAEAQSLKAVFVNGVWVGNIPLAACPSPAQHLLCGEMDLNTQEGEAVPALTSGQAIQVGLAQTYLAGKLQ